MVVDVAPFFIFMVASCFTTIMCRFARGGPKYKQVAALAPTQNSKLQQIFSFIEGSIQII
jgi:hypothetical protein